MKAVRYVGHKACHDPEYHNRVVAPTMAIVDTLPKGANVTVKFELDGKPLMVFMAPRARDFLDMAVTVYIIDEMADRSQAADFWSRRFDLVFPVHSPTIWQSTAPLLRRTLHTLSGDAYDWGWPERGPMPKPNRHKRRLPKGFDAVCLFSGGMDSLVGAYQLLATGRRVLLVGHQADSITAAAQKLLASKLQDLFPDQLRLVQSRVARSLAKNQRFSLPDKVEDSHRVRSFLFLGLAVTVAQAAGIKEIVMPENGLIALNAPLQPSRIGSLSTRTAHPLFLSQFLDFLLASGIYKGRFNNPLLYMSKTDILEKADAELKCLLHHSVSCAHAGDVRWLKIPGIKHCGYCVPCLYRRAAMASIGLDHVGHYGVDVLRNLKDLTPYKQADFRALMAFAQRVRTASRTERELIVLSHGAFSPDLGAKLGPYPAMDLSPWSEMLLRWAEAFWDFVLSQASATTRRIVGVRRAVSKDSRR